MSWLDFTIALSNNLSSTAFWVAIVTTIVTIACAIGFAATNKEFEGIEFLAFMKTFGTIAAVTWIVASLPSVKEVQKIQIDNKPAVEVKEEKPKKKIKKTYTAEEVQKLLETVDKGGSK